MDILAVSFLQQALEALRMVPRLLPADVEALFRDEAIKELAHRLFVDRDRPSLQQIAKQRGHKKNLKLFRQAVLEVLARTLGAILRAASGEVEGDEPDETGGESDPKLLEFISSMSAEDERKLAEELFLHRVPVDAIAKHHGFPIEAPEFVQQLLTTMRAVRDALPFDLHDRFGGGELEPVAALLFGEEPLDLMAVEDGLRKDHGYARPRDTVLGLLLNVIYAANGLTTPASGDEEDEA